MKLTTMILTVFLTIIAATASLAVDENSAAIFCEENTKANTAERFSCYLNQMTALDKLQDAMIQALGSGVGDIVSVAIRECEEQLEDEAGGVNYTLVVPCVRDKVKEFRDELRKYRDEVNRQIEQEKRKEGI